MRITIIFLVVSCLFACHNNQAHLKPRVATKDELTAYYDKMSHHEIKQIFKEQNIGQCLNEFQSQQIPNTNSACNCVLNNMVEQLSITDLKTMLLPAEYVPENIRHEIHTRSGVAMIQAVAYCKTGS